jgi:hypothetical protein
VGSTWCITRVFQRLISSHQRQPLHRVGLLGFSRRHIEHSRIELTGLAKEAAKSNIKRIWTMSMLIEMIAEIEAVRRNSSMSVVGPAQHLPQFGWGISVWKTDRHAHDRDIITRGHLTGRNVDWPDNTALQAHINDRLAYCLRDSIWANRMNLYTSRILS